MGRFLNFLTGGNPKVAAYALADLHYKLAEDYEAVFAAVFIDLCQRKCNNDQFVSLYLENVIHNYSELGAVQLNALAAPRGFPIYDTISDFRRSLTKHLLARHLSQTLFTGYKRHQIDKA